MYEIRPRRFTSSVAPGSKPKKRAGVGRRGSASRCARSTATLTHCASRAFRCIAQRGSAGGITLSDGYRKAIAQFSMDELHALFVAASDPLAELGVTGHERALHKLKGALPDLQRRAAEKAGERILLDHRKWYRAEQPGEILATLRRAVWDDRVVAISYRDRSGAVTERSIEPLGLVSKAGIWYVIARSANGGAAQFSGRAHCQRARNTAELHPAAGFRFGRLLALKHGGARAQFRSAVRGRLTRSRGCRANAHALFSCGLP